MYLAYAVIQQLINKTGKTKIGKTAIAVDNVVFRAEYIGLSLESLLVIRPRPEEFECNTYLLLNISATVYIRTSASSNL